MERPPKITYLEDLYPLSFLAQPCVEILRENMVTDVAHDEGHIVRVARNALWFAPDGNPDVIIAASILHDLVNIPKEDRENRKLASSLSAEKATTLLIQRMPFPFNGKTVDKIAHCIKAHSYSANVPCESIEAMAVQDADRVDSLGLIGVARCLGTSGKMGRALFDSFDPTALNRELDDYAYGLDHFKVKLFGLADTMKTERGKAFAKRLTKKMMWFYDGIVSEINGS